MKIANGLEMLEIRQGDRVVFPVFAWDETRRVLVDTGFPGQEPLFAEALSALGFSMDQVTEILLTHQDMDHIGCAKSFLDGAPGCRVMAHADEAPYLTGEKTPVKLAAMEASLDTMPEDRRAFYHEFRRGYKNRKLTNVTRLTDGETLPFCGGVKAIHTPGHTPGHLCLYFQGAKALVAGDALNIANGALAGPAPQHTLDMARATESLEKLLCLDVETVVCYHGGVFHGDVRKEIAALMRLP